MKILACLSILMLGISAQAEIRLQEVETGGQAAFQHGGSLSEVVCHPDGLHVLSASQDRCIRLWEIKTGKLVRRFTVPNCGDMWGIRFLKNGEECLAASSSNQVFRFKVATGELLKSYTHSGTAYRLAVLPDEKHFIGTDGSKKAVLWEIETGKKVRTFSGHNEDVYTAIVVNDGKTLITGSEDKSIKQWDIETGKCLKTVKGKTSYGDVFTLTPSPDRKQFAMVSDGGHARVFDSETIEEVWKTKLGEEGEVIAWAPDGSMIASTSDDSHLYLFDPKTGKIVKKIKTPNNSHTPITFTNDSRFIISGGDYLLHIHEVKTGKRIEPELGFADRYYSYDEMAVGPGGARIYISDGSSWEVKDLEDREFKKTMREDQSITAMAISKDGRFIALGGERGKITIRETKNFEVLGSMAQKGEVTELAFLPDGKGMVSAGENKDAVLWDFLKGDKLKVFKGHTDDIDSMALSPDGEQLVTISSDRSIRLWSVTEGAIQVAYKLDGKRPTGIAYLDGGRSLIASAGNKDVYARLLPKIDVKEEVDHDFVDQLVVQLGDDRFAKRQEAMKALGDLGKPVIPLLEVIETDDPEVGSRLAGVRDVIRGVLMNNAFKPVLNLEENLGLLRTDPLGEFWLGKLGYEGASKLVVGVVDHESESAKAIQTIDNTHGCLQIACSPDGTHVGTVNSDGTYSLFKVIRE